MTTRNDLLIAALEAARNERRLAMWREKRNQIAAARGERRRYDSKKRQK